MNKSNEQLKWESELFSNRIKEQESNNDYDGDDKCECGCRINSRGHCPRCDY